MTRIPLLLTVLIIVALAALLSNPVSVVQAAPQEGAPTLGPTPCQAQRIHPNLTGPAVDPCQLGAEMGRMKPCLKAEDCGAYESWKLMLGPLGERLAPLEPETVSTETVTFKAEPAAPEPAPAAPEEEAAGQDEQR